MDRDWLTKSSISFESFSSSSIIITQWAISAFLRLIFLRRIWQFWARRLSKNDNSFGFMMLLFVTWPSTESSESFYIGQKKSIQYNIEKSMSTTCLNVSEILMHFFKNLFYIWQNYLAIFEPSSWKKIFNKTHLVLQRI